MHLLSRKGQNFFWSMWCWSQLGERVLGSAEIILLQFVTKWGSECREKPRILQCFSWVLCLYCTHLSPFFGPETCLSSPLCLSPCVLSWQVILLLCITSSKSKILSLRISLGDNLLYLTVPGKWNSINALFSFHWISVTSDFCDCMTMKLPFLIALVWETWPWRKPLAKDLENLCTQTSQTGVLCDLLSFFHNY